MDGDKETSEINRVERENKEKFYDAVKQNLNQDITPYQDVYRKLYYEEGVFNTKKSRDLLERVMQELHPSLHYSEQTELILKATAKVFLI